MLPAYDKLGFYNLILIILGIRTMEPPAIERLTAQRFDESVTIAIEIVGRRVEKSHMTECSRDQGKNKCFAEHFVCLL